MQAVSDQFLAALRTSHGLTTEVTAYPPSGDPVVLEIEDGTVTIDRTADQRRRLDLTLSNALVYPDEPSDPVNVYGTELVVKRGVRLAGGARELVQLGVFRIQDAARTIPDGGVTITAWDRSMQVADQRFLAPHRVDAKLATDLIQDFITGVYPSAVFHITTADTTTIPKHVVDRDRWPEVQRVAQVIGCEVFADENGEWVIQDTPDPKTAVPVWMVDVGPGGVLVSATDSVTREGAPSVVVALGEGATAAAPVQSASPHGWNLDATSPTYALGAYGIVPFYYSAPHIRTTAQANRVADAQLADHLGVSRTIDFNAIPNPALDAGDAVQVNREGRSELHIIDTLTIPLSASGDMTGSTRAVNWNVS